MAREGFRAKPATPEAMPLTAPPAPLLLHPLQGSINSPAAPPTIDFPTFTTEDKSRPSEVLLLDDDDEDDEGVEALDGLEDGPGADAEEDDTAATATAAADNDATAATDDEDDDKASWNDNAASYSERI